ncbi:MAG: sodium:solute symporter, partial [Flavobacteriales bacterium]|nr:sodium:solute symporter [Flavobacteriales bacterium]
YGPLIGLFFFGLLTKRVLIDKLVLLVCLLVPITIGVLWYFSAGAPGVGKGMPGLFGDYKFGYELIIYNAVISFLALFLISKKNN